MVQWGVVEHERDHAQYLLDSAHEPQVKPTFLSILTLIPHVPQPGKTVLLFGSKQNQTIIGDTISPYLFGASASRTEAAAHCWSSKHDAAWLCCTGWIVGNLFLFGTISSCWWFVGNTMPHQSPKTNATKILHDQWNIASGLLKNDHLRRGSTCNYLQKLSHWYLLFVYCTWYVYNREMWCHKYFAQ